MIELIGLAWFTNLFVKFWIDRLRKYPNIQTLKPMSCQMCMGFWIGLAYFFLKHETIKEMFIFACITSFISVALNSIINKINEPRC